MHQHHCRSQAEDQKNAKKNGGESGTNKKKEEGRKRVKRRKRASFLSLPQLLPYVVRYQQRLSRPFFGLTICSRFRTAISLFHFFSVNEKIRNRCLPDVSRSIPSLTLISSSFCERTGVEGDQLDKKRRKEGRRIRDERDLSGMQTHGDKKENLCATAGSF